MGLIRFKKLDLAKTGARHGFATKLSMSGHLYPNI
uniref:Uncharacterized protein n=1 Tax=Setaria italica TaxID=4555 RepID=K4APK8_SETIT